MILSGKKRGRSSFVVKINDVSPYYVSSYLQNNSDPLFHPLRPADHGAAGRRHLLRRQRVLRHPGRPQEGGEGNGVSSGREMVSVHFLIDNSRLGRLLFSACHATPDRPPMACSTTPSTAATT